MKNLKEIMEEYNTTVEFPLLGQTLTVSAERNIYVQVRNKYRTMADDVQRRFTELIAQFDDFTSFTKGVKEAFMEAVKPAVNEVSKDAISAGCYTMSPDAVFKYCESNDVFSNFNDAYNRYLSNYKEIFDAYEAAVKEVCNTYGTPPNFQVATIGGDYFDTFSNQLQAEFTNAVINEVASSFAASKIAEIEEVVQQEIKKVFQNKSNQRDLCNSAWSSTADLILIYSNRLSKEENINFGGWVSGKNSEEANAMISNLTEIELPKEQQKEFVIKILDLIPTYYKAYKTALEKFPENLREIAKIADFFNVNISNLVSNVVTSLTAQNINESFESINATRDLIKDYISKNDLSEDLVETSELVVQTALANMINDFTEKNVGVTRKDAIDCKTRINELISKYGLQESMYTLALTNYDLHMEELDKQLVLELEEFVNSNLGTTEEEAHKCRNDLSNKIESEQLAPEKAADLFKVIDERLAKLDLEYRTVMGYTFETRDDADKQKAMLKEYDPILSKDVSEFIYRADYTKHIDEIKSLPLQPEILVKYVRKYEESLKGFDKLCKNAKLHDDKLKGEKKTLKGLFRSVLVSDEKQVDAWNRVTHNGQYKLIDIMKED